MLPATKINPPVFVASLFTTIFFALFTAIWPEVATQHFTQLQGFLVTKVSWIYVLSVAIFLLFVIFIMISRLGDIKLGMDHDAPAYTRLSWFSMLFSAGMGIGLMFFGVAEPVMHYMSPPIGDAATVTAAKEAMRITFFHWGLHAWGIYTIVALTLAYFSYRHGLPLLPRSALYPLIGDRIYGGIGHAVDTFAVVGTIFGVATSMGFGVQQLNAGLHYLVGVPEATGVQITLIIGITMLATMSVVLGLDRGIKRLSNLNMTLAVALMLFVLFFGPTILLLQIFVQNTGAYISEIVSSTFNLYAYDKKDDWIGGWTLLYWGWWVSWSPFVGMFIARVSKGRTIREFIIGVLFIPAGFTFLWMTVFGNTAINEIATNPASNLAEAVGANVPVALFVFFEQFPLSSLLSAIAICLITTFFITSADSGALVIDTLTSGGKEDTPVWQRIFWTSVIGIIAALLLSVGGLGALQTLTIASAFPFMFVLLIFCYSLFKALKADYMLQDSVQHHSTIQQFSKANWKKQLASLTAHPELRQAEKFIANSALPALEQLVAEFELNGITAELASETDNVRLIINIENAENFNYQIRLRHFAMPNYADDKNDDYYRAEVFLLRGGQQYDILSYSQEQIIADAITQYERHVHYLYLAGSEFLKQEPEQGSA
ncbi:BCCT family transporter [Porticoccaceae bacterium]|nr:BCCT family transporter [Porticoccaceae bacterium]MDC0004123.1 BCCT family transporter [Porticoccaceae bacterium]